jgi:2'-5' RNA ligase
MDIQRETIRAFVALDLDPTSLRRVARVADRLRMASGAPSATWVPAGVMHVTLKFVGELPIEVAAPLANELRLLVDGRAAPRACPFRLAAFPNLEAAQLVIAELQDASGELSKLAEDIAVHALKLGIKREDRPFRPHVTLARLKRMYDARRWLRGELAEGVGECRGGGLTMYRSELGATGAKHTPLAKFVFS